MLRRKRKLTNCRVPRHGVAATELAVCMPVIVLIVLATIEACAMIFLQQSLSVAAYEGARVSLAPGAQASNVEAQCQLILDDRDVRGAQINVSPGDIPGAAAGTWINVETSAPFAQNSLVGGWLFGNRTLTASVQMVKER
jgi:Flp pilus assembly protein TadG